MSLSADLIAILLVLAAALATINHRFIRLPRALALLLGSLGIALLTRALDPVIPIDVTGWVRLMLADAALPQVLLQFVLGLLLFAASLHVDLPELNRQKWEVLGLATAGVIISATVFGFGIWLLFGLTASPIPLGWCIVLGALLAPTDAVVIDALLRRAPLPAALKAAISGESLLNDGAGVVLFSITLGLAEGEHGLAGHGRVAVALAVQGLSGAVLGGVTGLLVARLIRWVDEAGLRLMISLALVAGIYRLAGAMGVSGPTAVVAGGLVLRSHLRRDTSGQSVMTDLSGFWAGIDEVLNALLFVLIGLQLFAIYFHDVVVLPLIAAWPLSVLSRLAGVALPVGMLRGSGRQERPAMAFLTWAGLHGGVSIALAFSLPPSPYRDQLLIVCYVVVVLSMVLQGMTMPRVIHRLYPAPPVSSAGPPRP